MTESPRKWVNLANLQPTEAAAKITGASDEADEVIPFKEYQAFEADLMDLRSVREQFSELSTKYVSEKNTNENFQYQVSSLAETFREKQAEIKRLKISIGLLLVLVFCGACVIAHLCK